MQTRWNGRVYSLDKFFVLRQNSFVQLREASDHINFHFPTEHSRVGFLIDNTSNSYTDLRAGIDSFCINTNNMHDEFDGAAGFLLPVCPYSKHQNQRGRSTSNRQGANICDATLGGKSSSNTVVYLCWHKHDEYSEVSPKHKHK